MQQTNAGKPTFGQVPGFAKGQVHSSLKAILALKGWANRHSGTLKRARIWNISLPPPRTIRDGAADKGANSCVD
jgi:hypothetical protein